MSRLVASFALAGVALVGVTAPAFASKPDTKPDTTHKQVCHPTGKGWTLINPAQASSHIDESTGAPKHKHNGHTDVYAVNGACPVVSTPTPTTTGGTPSATQTSSPTTTASTPTTSTTTSATATSTSSQSPSPSSSTHGSTTPTSPTGSSYTSTRPSSSPTAPRTSPPSSVSTTTSRTTSPASPRRSGPSSTVAPPEELARTGFDWVVVFAAALLLLVGALSHAARVLGRKGTHR